MTYWGTWALRSSTTATRNERLAVGRAIAVRDLRHRPEKFHRSLGPTAFEVSEMRGFRASRLSFRLAWLLPLEVASINVFRAALVSVVLTLAIGPNAGLLCTAWCVDATSTGCPHQDSTVSPSVRGDDTCNEVGAVAFVPEDGRRIAPGPDSQNALVVTQFRSVPSQSNSRFGYGSGQQGALEARPLAIALRI